MKKILITFILLFNFMFTISMSVSASEPFNAEAVTLSGGTYQVTERTNYDSLDYGLQYTRDLAVSNSKNIILLESSPRTKESFDPQVVNVLEVPTSSQARIVNWTYSSNGKWTKATITKLAKDFEAHNPGWVVLAGINGDFFDINGNGALQYQTTSSAVNNGEVVRAVDGRHVGFTNDGSTNTLIGGETIEFTNYHNLAIYDKNQDIMKTFKVDKFNEIPNGDEIAVYFSYHKFDENGSRIIQFNNSPATNSYLVESSERGYAISSSSYYGKGFISSKNVEKELNIGQFAVVTNNPEVLKYLEDAPCIRIQQDVVGAYASCENISGCGAQLLYDGEFRTSSDGMSNYAHPRTVIGQKSDGTIVMATVDGRQFEKNMYGMTYEELSAMMKYYDCSEAYNLDGGGSTTMILRNSQGGFDVMNTPSDGGERSDSNAILVVVPEMKLSIDQATDSTVSLSYVSKAKNISITNVSVTITGQNYQETKNINESSFTWDGLLPNTEYEIVYSYDIDYLGKKSRNTSYPMTFKTGNPRPTVGASYEELGDNYVLYFQIADTSNSLINIQLRYDNRSIMLDKNTSIYYLAKSDVKDPTFKIHLIYNVNATPNSNVTEIIEIKEIVVEEPVTPEPPQKEKSGCLGGTIIIELLVMSSLLAVILRRKK